MKLTPLSFEEFRKKYGNRTIEELKKAIQERNRLKQIEVNKLLNKKPPTK